MTGKERHAVSFPNPEMWTISRTKACDESCDEWVSEETGFTRASRNGAPQEKRACGSYRAHTGRSARPAQSR